MPLPKALVLPAARRREVTRQNCAFSLLRNKRLRLLSGGSDPVPGRAAGVASTEVQGL
jgi:hypothetical protein